MLATMFLSTVYPVEQPYPARLPDPDRPAAVASIEWSL